MPNNKVISSQIEPVNTDTNDDYYSQVAAEGMIFNATTGAQSVAANGYLTYQLTVPANKDKTIYIISVTGGSASNSSISEFKNAYFSGAGTAITPANSNWDHSGGSICSVKWLSQATDPTSGGIQTLSFLGIGGTLAYSVNGRVQITSSSTSQTFYLRLTNRSSQANLCSIGIVWWEG